ncbi:MULTISPECIES: GGDEF domain-containing protein [Halomonas]|uniref:GGDEF domain-containing protein n=1 Tax=Halomonas TaxID=2745 RepID=UPI0020B74A64|nr:GGDEF domain-containing protein [Halomonas sp. 3H]
MRCLPALLWSLLLLLLVVPAAQSAAPPLAVDQGWEYRWGDSPLAPDGRPAWLAEDEGWQDIAYPSNPPDREGRRHVWFRTTLPDGEWRDPVLYLTSIDLIGQIYLDGELLYQYGEFDAQGQGDFAGWPWHLIELPEDFAGKALHVRVYSYYTDIGLWGEIRIMDRIALLKQIIQDSLKDLTVGAFVLLLAVLAGIFALLGPDRRAFGGLALFAFASGTMLLAEAPIRQLLLDRALLWDTLRAASYFTLPVAMGILLASWLDETPRRWIRRLWQLHLAYLVGAIGLVQAGAISLSLTFPAFDALLAITLPLMLLLALWQFTRLSHEQRLVVASFILFAPLLLADMLVAHGLVAWRTVPLSLGTLGFSLAIVGVSLWHYRRTRQELDRLNHSLEQQVADRTLELGRLVQKLEGLSYEDALTGLKNRRHFDELLKHEAARGRRTRTPLALVMIDIDHFKRFNDLHGHEAGDAVLAAVGGLLRQSFRDGDVVCRLGGEEFVVVMPGATAATAEARIGRLLQGVRGYRFRHRDRELEAITLSCGVAAFPEHGDDPLALTRLADRALYRAKHRGRDRSETWSLE